jgi:hypothetical protein
VSATPSATSTTSDAIIGVVCRSIP